jgi:shikimate dehydrogenase
VEEQLNRAISASTRLCAVLGHPIRHSASPAMHNAALAALDMDWRYVAFDVDPSQLPEALRGAKAMRMAGLNLTVPHKLLALKLMDALDDSAAAYGAVNTVRFEAQDRHGQWLPIAQAPDDSISSIRSHGFNTDADAILRSLKEDLAFQPRGASVLLLGVGGAGQVAALILASEGVETLHIVNRTLDKAQSTAAAIRERFPQVTVVLGYPSGTVDLLLNATSLGLKPEDPLPLDEQAFPIGKAGAVYDMIYRPSATPLLAKARAAGCRSCNGMGMLLYQGARALELWTGRPAPIDIMRQALEKHLNP